MPKAQFFVNFNPVVERKGQVPP